MRADCLNEFIPGFPRVVILLGPSATGKTTLSKMLLEEYGDKYRQVVSHTTRSKRDGEKDGRDYHFVSYEEFNKLIEEDKVVEYTQFAGSYYGMSKKEFYSDNDQGKISIVAIDENGVDKILQLPKVFTVVITVTVGNMDIIYDRLKIRKSENPGQWERRIAQAKKTLDYIEQHGTEFYKIVNDGFIEDAYKQLKKLLNSIFKNDTL